MIEVAKDISKPHFRQVPRGLKGSFAEGSTLPEVLRPGTAENICSTVAEAENYHDAAWEIQPES